nr:uncharacterized protein LOC128692281 [Cherax quadricarinatus]
MEISSTQSRSRLGPLFAVPWSIGYMVIAGVAYLVRSWQWLQVTITLPALLFTLYYWLLPESPRWLILHNQLARALEVLHWAAKVNDKKLPPDHHLLSVMEKIAAKEKQPEIRGGRVLDVLLQELKHIVSLVRVRTLRRRSLIVFFCWLAASVVYYGVALNSTNLSINTYLYIFLGGLLEMPSYILLWPAVVFLGRVKSLSVLYCTTGSTILLISVVILFIPETPWVVVMLVSLIGKTAITAAYQLVWMMTAELFPTKYRSLALGHASFLGKTGSILSPYINDILTLPDLSSLEGIMSVSSLSAALGLLVTAVVAQLPFTTIPTISDEIKGNALTGKSSIVHPPVGVRPGEKTVRDPHQSTELILNRVRRQLQFPGLKGLGDFDPVLRRGAGDLTLPRGFKLNTSTFNSYNESREHRFSRFHASMVRYNPPLDPLTSIDRFATVYKLSGSPEESVVSTLQREGLTTLLVLLETSGLLNFLISGEKGPYIVLAPSEAAFSQLTRKELRQLSRGNDLAYHLIPLRGQPAPEVTNDSTFKTLLGPELRFNVYGNSVFVNGVAVSRGDLPFSHGTIQVVDSVLEVPVGEIQAVLVGSGHSYSRVNTLLSASDLVQSGKLNYGNVMAHTNFAFWLILIENDTCLRPELLNKKKQERTLCWDRRTPLSRPRVIHGLDCSEPGLRRDLLARHSIRGAWYSEGLLQQRTLATLAGTTVTFRKDLDGTCELNGVEEGGEGGGGVEEGVSSRVWSAPRLVEPPRQESVPECGVLHAWLSSPAGVSSRVWSAPRLVEPPRQESVPECGVLHAWLSLPAGVSSRVWSAPRLVEPPRQESVPECGVLHAWLSLPAGVSSRVWRASRLVEPPRQESVPECGVLHAWLSSPAGVSSRVWSAPRLVEPPRQESVPECGVLHAWLSLPGRSQFQSVECSTPG